jgi:hypothetical protein
MPEVLNFKMDRIEKDFERWRKASVLLAWPWRQHVWLAILLLAGWLT